jgi:hypothetical protein
MAWAFVGLCGVAACEGGLTPDPELDASAEVDASAVLDSAGDGPAQDLEPAERLLEGVPCEGADGAMLACEGSLLCCRPCCDGRPAVCTRPASNQADIGVGRCPLPDLTVNVEALQRTLGVSPATYSPSGCEVRERCVDKSGVRQTLHFEVNTPNIGTADLVLGPPQASAGFVYARCHGHFHHQGYALYQLFDPAGSEVIRGQKRAFCLLDSTRVRGFPLTERARPFFSCDDQGISVGWSDSYDNGLPCQFIDITSLAPGRYTLRVTVNPDRVFPELSYDNNIAETAIDIPAPPALPTDPCQGQVGGINRECGWKIAGSYACTPDTRVTVGCGQVCGLGPASGEPMLRVCEGDGVCQWPGLGSSDTCSPTASGAAVSIVCPAGGRFTVLTAPTFTNKAARCEVAVR